MKKIVDHADAIIVSPARREEVQKMAGRRKKIIEFLYRPDDASTNHLNIVLLEGKK